MSTKTTIAFAILIGLLLFASGCYVGSKYAPKETSVQLVADTVHVERELPGEVRTVEVPRTEYVYRTVTKERLVLDTLYLDRSVVGVPRRVVPDSGLAVLRPVFGAPRVVVTGFNPEQGRFERSVVEIEEHPLKGGVQGDAFYGRPFSGAEVGAYVGWKQWHLFGAGGIYYGDGVLQPGYRLGVRARFGR